MLEWCHGGCISWTWKGGFYGWQNKEYLILWEKRQSCGLKLDNNDTEYFYACHKQAPSLIEVDGQKELVAGPEVRRMGNAQGERLEKDEKFGLLHGWYLFYFLFLVKWCCKFGMISVSNDFTHSRINFCSWIDWTVPQLPLKHSWSYYQTKHVIHYLYSVL